MLGGGPSFLSTINNSNAGNNGNFGVACAIGGYVSGLIGSLSGGIAPKAIDAPCQDFLS